VVFPEGAREFADGKFLEFKTGAVKIAAQAKVPLLPVTITGAHRIWPRDQKYPKLFRRVTITYHPLIPLADRVSDEQIENITDSVRQVIEGEGISS
jgi:1-acyl-sn-glycerol-3-phosphate acyltransferase